jgi:hypothetical protein
MSLYVVKCKHPRRAASQMDPELWNGRLVDSGNGTKYSSPSAAIKAITKYITFREKRGQTFKSILCVYYRTGTLRVEQLNAYAQGRD